MEFPESLLDLVLLLLGAVTMSSIAPPAAIRMPMNFTHVCSCKKKTESGYSSNSLMPEKPDRIMVSCTGTCRSNPSNPRTVQMGIQ